MTNKTNILLDKITRGVAINKNNEVNYLASIYVDLEKDTFFEYAIVDEGDEDVINFKEATKNTIIKHQNSNNIYKRSILMLKSNEKTNAVINIEIENLYPREFLVETLGPTGKVILQNDAASDEKARLAAKLEEEKKKEKEQKWYEDPWTLGAIVLGIIIIAMILMSKNNQNERSLFV